MKTTKRILSLVFLLVLVCALLPAPEASAAKNGYMSLEEAGAVLREYMVSRNTSEKEIKFYLDEARQLYNTEAYDLLLAEAVKHTGVGNEGDALKWVYKSVGYGITDDFDGTTHYITLTMQGADYYTTAAQEQELNTKVQQILQQLNLDGKSDYEKVFAVYDYVCKNVRYSEDVFQSGTGTNPPPEHFKYYSAYGALVQGEAVCQGFAIAMYRLLLELGIDNRLIDGDNHGWNIVKLGNLYYCLDATWDSDTYHLGDGNYKYFLKGASDFWTVGHTPNVFFAKESFRNQYPISPVDYGAEVTATGSGKCGDNANWTLTADGTLTISGSGAIYDMNDALENWNGLDEYVKKIVIQSGITSIGAYAFHNFQEVREVSIPDSVTSIGGGAFGLCTKLSSITIPNSVTSLGSSVFTNCFSLKEATLPNGISTVPYGAFSNCAQLESITIPNGVTTIEENAFYSCYGLKSVALPDTLKSIGGVAFASAFDANAKVKITIPSSVTEVGLKCFAWSNVQEVVWNANTETLDYWMFYLCHYLEKITISDSVKVIGESAFQDCNLLKDVKLPTALREVGSSIFLGCASLRDIQLPDTLEDLSVLMFSDCKSLTQINLPDGITVIPINAFNGSGLTSIDLEGIVEIGEGAFTNAALKEVIIPASVKKLNQFAFGNPGLEKMTFMGDAPSNLENSINGRFIVYYPEGNATWTQNLIEQLRMVAKDAVAYRVVGGEHFVALKWMSDDTSHWYGCLDCDHKENVTPHDFENNCDMDCGVCGYQRSITHVYDQQKFNEGFHWMECACGDIWEETVHSFDNFCDATCSGCAYVREPLHSYYIRKTDDVYHWFECDCGAKGQVEAHQWADYGACDICGEPKPGESHTHTMTDVWLTDGQSHWKQCTDCSFIDYLGDHYYTGNGDTECDICGYIRTVSHNMGSAWVTDSQSHWKQCTDCDYKEGKASHRYADNCDASCEDCGYTRTVSHNFQWKSDDSQHWKVCACGATEGSPAAHTWGNGVCTACGKVQPHTHSMGTQWRSNSQTHWKQCTGCDYKENEASHRYSGSCDTTCEDCGAVRTVTHNYQWKWNDDQHWKICTCGASESAPTDHTWSGDKCSACGAEKPADPVDPGPSDTHTHTMGSQWKSNSQSHWHQCTGCSYKEDEAAHSYTDNCDATCDDCGYLRTVSHDYQWQWNDEQHWKSCTCGATEDTPASHTWSNGICTACGAEKPAEPTLPPDPTDPPVDPTDPTEPSVPTTAPAEPQGKEPDSNGFIWVIVAAIVVVAAGAAAAVVIVMKKKK